MARLVKDTFALFTKVLLTLAIMFILISVMFWIVTVLPTWLFICVVFPTLLFIVCAAYLYDDYEYDITLPKFKFKLKKKHRSTDDNHN